MIPTKSHVLNHGKPAVCLDFGIDSTTHKRRRLFFPDDKLANAELSAIRKRIRQGGEWWASLKEEERLSIAAVVREMKSAGLVLSEVWAEFKRLRAEVKAQSTTTPCAYEDAVAEWNRRKLAANTGERYVDSSTALLLKFGEGRLRKNMHEIILDELEGWFTKMTKEEEWGPSRIQTYQLVFSSLWSVCMDKGWVTFNLADRLEPIKNIVVPVRIYDNATTMNIMAGVMHSKLTQQIIAPVSLGFFGCMRPEEVTSEKAKAKGLPESEYFGWRDIDLKHALCKVRITKTGDERTIRLQPCAVEWLMLGKELKNPLPPVNERRLIDSVCDLIGLDEWIRDGLRKNCATHLRQVYKKDFEVVSDCGNSIKVLLKHYAALHIPEVVSLEHWKITPDAVTKYMKTDAWKKVLEDAAAKAA